MTTLDTGTADLLAEIDDGVAVITMSRPDRRNALSQAMLSALALLASASSFTLGGTTADYLLFSAAGLLGVTLALSRVSNPFRVVK